jgi:hypothetical protein
MTPRVRTIDQGLLRAAIFEAQNGTVSTIVGIDTDFLRRWLDVEQYDDSEHYVVLLDQIRTSSLQSLLNGYVGILADAAQRVWPAWYGTIFPETVSVRQVFWLLTAGLRRLRRKIRKFRLFGHEGLCCAFSMRARQR